MDDQYQFINSIYIFPRKNPETGEFNDTLIISYKVNGEQKLQVIENPMYSFYAAKPDVIIPHCLDNIEYDKCDRITVPYKDLNRTLAKYNGREEEYFRLKSNYGMPVKERRKAQRKFIEKCQQNPRLFETDVDINDFYKMEFIKKYGVNIGGYKKAAFDIETDGLGSQKDAKFPVNCLSYFDFTTKTMYQLFWDQPDRWPTYREFKEYVQNGGYEKELRADPEMNGEFEKENNLPPRLSINDCKIVIEFYEDEFELLTRFFDIVHMTAPDFAGAWNYTFDLNYMINRLIMHIKDRHINTRIEDIVCDPDVPPAYRVLNFKEDHNPKAEYYSLWHWFEISGKTTYIDYMATYADVRKGRGVLGSYGLNDVCMVEMKKGKVDYYDIADNAAELPYKDFTKHAHYNFRDTFLLVELECTNADIDSLMYNSQYTRLSKATRQTSTFKNLQQMFYDKIGLAIGNNVNIMRQQPAVPYKGAIVAAVMLNKPIITPLFPYLSSTVRPFVIDFDQTSMYPMINVAYNIYRTTLLMHVVKIGSVNQNNPPNDDPGSIDVLEAFDNWQVDRPVRWGHDYLQLPDFGQLIVDLKDKLVKDATKRGISIKENING